MKAFWTLAMLILAGAILGACNSTATSSPAANAKGAPLGNTGVQVSGYAEGGATGTAR